MPNWTKEQLEAINTEGTNILVSAGAGSGKTAVLSSRVLRKVKDGVNIDRILILTFTKAAAYEMMVRIRKKLLENNLMNQVMLIDKSYITTFDSYSLSVVSKYHDILGLNSNIKIIDKNSIDIFKQEQLDNIFLKYYQSNNQLFNKLISDFCLRDDKELKQYILKLNSSLDLKYDKKEYLNKYLDNYYNEEYLSKVKKEYLDLIFENIDKLKEEVNKLSLMIDGNDFYEVLSPLFNAKTFIEVKNNLSVSLPRLPKNSGELASSVKKNISCILDDLKELTNKDIDNSVSEYLSTKDYVKVIIDIILELDEVINTYKYKHNTFEFVDISKLAIDLVKNNSEIREEITNSFDEIMIDEYQDTSDLQELFISLIANNNTYMVGDIKQSIYRFRNANPNIFKEKYLRYEKNDSGIKIDLNKNFRSRNEVLNNINRIFNEVMDLPYGGAEYKKSHQMVFGNNTYIEEGKTEQNYDLDIYNYNYDKDSVYKKYDKSEIEAFIIANDIKDKINNKYQIFDKDKKELHDIKYSDFVILVDRSTKFTLFKEIFEYLHIPLTIYKDIDISKSVEVKLIRNILKMINCVLKSDYSNTFKYSYMSIARSYLFRLDDDIIYDTVINNKYYDSEIYKIVKELVDNITKYDLKTLLKEIKDKFDFDSKMISASDIEIRIAILEYFINLAGDLSELDYDLDMFIKYLDTLNDENVEINIPVSVGDNNSVRIMTIHKSKGLEYPICYYTMLSSGFNISDLKDKVLFDNTYGVITPSFINGYSDTFIKTLVKKKYLKEEISEKIRLLYVALTRCMEKMIVVSNLSLDSDEINKDKYKSFKDILDSINKELENFIIPVDLDKLNLNDDYKKKDKKELDKFIKKDLLVNEYKNNEIEVEEEHFSKVVNKILTPKEIANMKFGIRIHKVFELMDFKNPNYDLLSNEERKYVERFLSLDLLKDVKSSNIIKEYQFYNDKNEHGIIDLMLEYSDHIDIIDYKLSNIDDINYVNQLNGYKNYIEKKMNKNTNIYLYSIINNTIKKL